MDVTLLQWGDRGWGDELLKGALMTLNVGTCAYVLGLVVGAGMAVMKLSRYRILRAVANTYTTVIRGIPELIIIYLVFFGGGVALRAVAKGLFGYGEFFDPPVFATGVLCIGLISGAYSTEVIRGAVLAVPGGLLDASRALGMSRRAAWMNRFPFT